MTHRFSLGALALALPLLGACAETPPRPVVAPPVPAAEPALPDPAEDISEPAPRDPEVVAAEAEAQATSTAGSTRLGQTVASLGDAGSPGLWIRTGLVSEVQQGRIENASTGQTAAVELRPLGGEGGGQLSIAAMQAIGASLTDLPTVTVYGD